MKLFEVTLQYHDELNPKLWDQKKLKPEVLAKLREIADAFIKFLDVPNLPIEDIVMIGSAANYNYTETSDIDLHLIMNVKRAAQTCKDFTEELFDAKNDVWKEKHQITIYGVPVEVFIQDNTTDSDKVDGIERHITGVYSIKDGKWLKKPKHSPPDVNDKAVVARVKNLKRLINKVVDGDAGSATAKKLQKKIKAGRRSGLSDSGEFSVENLVYKELRHNGAMDKLLNYIRDSKTDELSLK